VVNTDYDKVRLNDPNIRATRHWVAQVLDSWTARHLTTHIHANSNAVKAAAVRDLRISPEKITVIEQGRDSIRLGQPSAQRRDRARLLLGLQEDQEVLINVGRQDYQKGHRYLLEAVRGLIPTHPRLVLLVAGRSGDASRELEHLRDRFGLREQVLFLGQRDDVPDILASADLFVFPSLYEGLPGAVIEAMALGLPVIASSIEPVRETVEEGRNALLVKPASPVELATAIEHLLEDRETAHAFGQRSREIFEERFTLERSIVRKIDLYRQVLSLN
jgi:glycosyltransferase involved in cell wall biosynthesis